MAWFTEYQRWLSESESLNNAQMVADHFAASWSKEAIAALCGNMRHESSINPDMYEYGYAWGADRGYGLVQWTPRSKYTNWAAANNLPFREGNSQLARIDYEVEQNIQWIPIARYGGMTFKQFRENAGGWSVDYLTEAFTWCYERPNATAGENSMPARKAFANRVFNELDFTGQGGKPAWPTADGLPITSKYGYRGDIGVPGASQYHWAIDIGSGGMADPPIYATQDGVVTGAGTYSNGGVYVIIKHTGDQYWSRYLHLKSYSVNVGQTVQKGDLIGIMGATGIGSGVHLDFAISINGVWQTEESTIDPEDYLQMSFGGGGGSPSPSRPAGGVAAISPPTQYKYAKEGTVKLMTYYEVKPGDTLSQIAAKHNVPMAAIQRVRFQPIVNANALSKGEVLLLPKAVKTGVKQTAATPKTHVVKAGETLSGIAKKYNTSVGRLAMNNRIGDPNKITVGQRIDIYG